MKKIWIILVLLFSIHAFAMEPRFADISGRVGFPDAVAFEIGITKLSPFKFGFGLGIMPLEQITKNYLNFKSSNYTQEVSGYTVTPSVSMSWTTFTGFLEYMLTDVMFLRAFYTTWKLDASVSVNATGGMLGSTSLNVGSASFSLYQPLAGFAYGWRFNAGSTPYYFDLSLGLMKFLSPRASIGINTVVDPYKNLLPQANQDQISQAWTEINGNLSTFIKQYKAKIHYAPSILFSFGRHI